MDTIKEESVYTLEYVENGNPKSSGNSKMMSNLLRE